MIDTFLRMTIAVHGVAQAGEVEEAAAEAQEPAQGPSSRFLLVAVGLYIFSTTAFLIWRGISVSPDYLLIMLLLAAIVLGRWKAFLVDWLPFVALFLGYEFLRGIANVSGIPAHYSGVIAADRFLGFGEVPTIWLQHHLYTPGRVGFLEYAATIVYFCHFAYPLGLGYLFWIKDRVLFRRFAAALLGMSFCAFIFYLLVPVGPPWLAAEKGYLPHVEKIIAHTMQNYTSWVYHRFNPNEVAAMPSLHAAFPTLGLLYATRAFGRKAWILALWCLVVWFAIVYMGEHYLIDVLAGVATAVTAFTITEVTWSRLSRRRSGPGQTGQAQPRGYALQTVDVQE